MSHIQALGLASISHLTCDDRERNAGHGRQARHLKQAVPTGASDRLSGLRNPLETATDRPVHGHRSPRVPGTGSWPSVPVHPRDLTRNQEIRAAQPGSGGPRRNRPARGRARPARRRSRQRAIAGPGLPGRSAPPAADPGSDPRCRTAVEGSDGGGRSGAWPGQDGEPMKWWVGAGIAVAVTGGMILFVSKDDAIRYRRMRRML